MDPATESFATPDDLGDIQASQLHTSLGERLGAQAGEAFMGGVRSLARIGEYRRAETSAIPDTDEFSLRMYHGIGRPAERAAEVPIADAKARVKQEGLEGHFKLPDQATIKQPVLDLMVEHARERQQYDAAVSRGPQGFLPDALGFITEMGVGIIDPVNAAAFSIPVIGEARFGKMMASAGESWARRAAVRAGVGTVQGAVGTTLLQPSDWWLHTKDGQDYTMADALRSIIMGAGMGGAFHAGFGAVGDVRARLAGRPLPGSPEDIVERTLTTLGLPKGEPTVGAGFTADIPPTDIGATGQTLESNVRERSRAAAPAPAPEPERSLDDIRPGDVFVKPNGKTLEIVDAGGGRVQIKTEITESRDMSPAQASQLLKGEEGLRRSAPRARFGGGFVDLESGTPMAMRLHPAEVLADLPPRVREDALRATVADVTAGNAARTGEMLNEAAKQDPRIAESFPPEAIKPDQRPGADWQRVADARRPDDEDLADASKVAEDVPEPDSVNREKSLSAAEAAAKEAEALLADILPGLSDEERKTFEDALNQLDQDKMSMEQIVRDGAACLAAAVA